MDYTDNILSVADLIVPFFWTPILMLVLSFWIVKRYGNEPWNRFFIPGFLVRILSVVVFGLVYQFIYGYGDTFIYFAEARNIRNAFVDNDWDSFSELLFYSYDSLSLRAHSYISEEYLYQHPTNHFVVTIAGLLNVLCFDSYISVAIFFMSFGYVGTWLMFRECALKFPESQLWVSVIFIFLPTTFFWGSGLMKEPLCLGALGFLISGILRFYRNHPNYLGSLLFVLFGAFLLYNIKSYLLYSVLAALAIVILLQGIRKIKGTSQFSFLRSVLYFLFVMASFYAIFLIGSSFQGEIFEQLLLEINSTQIAQIEASAGGGSGYELPDLDPSPLGLVSFSSIALATTFFRPFPWEVSSPIVLINSLEGLITFFLTTLGMFKVGLRRFFHMLSKNHWFQFSFFYAILLGVVVGVISFNYGTLVRYKAPVLPFYYLFIFFLFQPKQEA